MSDCYHLAKGQTATPQKIFKFNLMRNVFDPFRACTWRRCSHSVICDKSITASCAFTRNNKSRSWRAAVFTALAFRQLKKGLWEQLGVPLQVACRGFQRCEAVLWVCSYLLFSRSNKCSSMWALKRKDFTAPQVIQMDPERHASAEREEKQIYQHWM